MLLSHIKDVIRTMIKNNTCDINICLEGHQGIGKTEILKQIAEECGWNYTAIYCAQTSTEDLLGMPRVVEDGDSFKTVFAKPVLFPDKENTIFVLEEINRAPLEVQQSVLQLLTDRKIGNYKLPKNTIICACINPTDSIYRTQELDSVFVNRMVKIQAETSPEEFISYAKEHGVRQEIINFISRLNNDEKRIYFSQMPSDENLGKPIPSPRTWMIANKILNLEIQDKPTLFLMLCGALGDQCASRFVATLNMQQVKVDYKQILKSFYLCKDELTKMKESNIYKLVEDLISELKVIKSIKMFKEIYPLGVTNLCEFFIYLCDNNRSIASVLLSSMYKPETQILHDIFTEYNLHSRNDIFSKINKLMGN